MLIRHRSLQTPDTGDTLRADDLPTLRKALG